MPHPSFASFPKEVRVSTFSDVISFTSSPDFSNPHNVVMIPRNPHGD